MDRSLREVSRYGVVNESGRRIGRIHEVLFHPDRNEVVGYIVVRPRFLYLFDRRDRYLSRELSRVRGSSIEASARDAWDRRAERLIGIAWDNTVIWYGMPVRTKSGTHLGTVRDALFDESTGALRALGLTGGITADTALGVRDLSSKLVQGFDGEAIVVSDEALGVEAGGGAAQLAGRGVAVAKVQAGETAKVAAKAAQTAAKTAASYGRSAVKVAAKSDSGKKAVGWLKAVRDEVVDAMGPPDDD